MGIQNVPQRDDDAPRELDPRLRGKFELVGIRPGKIFIFKQDYDFRKMSVETAESLVERGCSYIKRITTEQQTATKAVNKGVANQKPQEERNRK